MVDLVKMKAVGNYLSQAIKSAGIAPNAEPEILRFGNLDFIAVKNTETFAVKNYQKKVENLLFTLTHDGLFVYNSLHKYHDENSLNYSDFTFSQLCTVIDEIEFLTGIPAQNFKIFNIELALNIKTADKPTSYLGNFRNYKTKEFDKMKTDGFCYGIKYCLSEFNIKIYDKTEEVKRSERVKIEDNIMRFEMQYNKARAIKDLDTLQDLRDVEKLGKSLEKMLKTFQVIPYLANVNLSNFTPRQRMLYYAGQDKDFWTSEKKTNHNTAKSIRNEYKALIKKIDENKSENFIEKLREKAGFLLSK